MAPESSKYSQVESPRRRYALNGKVKQDEEFYPTAKKTCRTYKIYRVSSVYIDQTMANEEHPHKNLLSIFFLKPFYNKLEIIQRWRAYLVSLLKQLEP